MRHAVAALTLALMSAAVPAFAQTQLPQVAVLPVTIVLPNYNSIPVGEIGSLEGGAYLARVQDGSATYFNPAGLAKAQRSSVSGSAGSFNLSTVTPNALVGTGSSFNQMPASVGVVVKHLFGQPRVTGGFHITTTTNWNTSIDAQRELSQAGTTERGGYSSNTSLNGWIASLALGFEMSPRLRLGGSLDAQVTSSGSNVSWNDQYQTPTGLSALALNGHAGTTFWHGRLTGGVQYDLSPTIRLAGMVRTPGVGLWKSGSRYQDGTYAAGAGKVTATLFEPDAEVAFKLPVEFRLGAAYIGKRAQVEVNVMYYGAGGTYDALVAKQPVVVLTDPGAGGPPSRQEYAAAPVVVDSVSVVNVGIGGQFTLTRDGKWKLHAGFSTDQSPVGAADTRFMKVDMQTWTAGFSGDLGVLLGSLGVRYETGTSGPITLRRLQNGDTLTTALDVRNVGIVYSFSFRF